MSADLKIIPSEIKHIEFIAPRMRRNDVAEIMASHGHSAHTALELALIAGGPTFTAIGYGQPVAMFGVHVKSALASTGNPWLLGTDVLLKMTRELVALGAEATDAWARRYHLLENYVHVNNTRSVRWLKHIGYSFDEPAPYGIAGEQFMRFYKVSDHV